MNGKSTPMASAIAQIPEPTQVQLQINIFDKAIGELLETYSQLEHRLNCVSHPILPMVKEQTITQEIVPLAADIRALRFRIEQLTENIHNTIAVLEI